MALSTTTHIHLMTHTQFQVHLLTYVSLMFTSLPTPVSCPTFTSLPTPVSCPMSTFLPTPVSCPSLNPHQFHVRLIIHTSFMSPSTTIRSACTRPCFPWHPLVHVFIDLLKSPAQLLVCCCQALPLPLCSTGTCMHAGRSHLEMHTSSCLLLCAQSEGRACIPRASSLGMRVPQKKVCVPQRSQCRACTHTQACSHALKMVRGSQRHAVPGCLSEI